VSVTWAEAADRRADPNAPPRAPTVNRCAFTMPAGIVRSETIRVNGTDFQTLSERRCSLPPDEAVHDFRYGVAVFNRGEKDFYFAPDAFHIGPRNIETFQGGELQHGGGGGWKAKPMMPVRIPPEWSHVFVFTASVERSEIGPGYRLQGAVRPDSTWFYEGLDSGRYRLSFECGIKPGPWVRPDQWTGNVRTKHVEFELVKE